MTIQKQFPITFFAVGTNPAVPTGLALSNAHGSEAWTRTPTLTWDNQNTQSYEVEIRPVLIGDATDTTASTNYTSADTLINMTIYSARIRAVHHGRKSDWSSPIQFGIHESIYRDDMSTDQAAPITTRTGNVGTATVVGDGSNLSVSGGTMTMANASTPTILQSAALTRQVGLCIYWQMPSRLTDEALGVSDSSGYIPTTNNVGAIVFRTAGNMSDLPDNTTAGGSAFSNINTEGTTGLEWLMVLMGSGAVVFERYAAGTNLWRMIHRSIFNTDSTLYSILAFGHLGGFGSRGATFTKMEIFQLDTGDLTTENDWCDYYSDAPNFGDLLDLFNTDISIQVEFVAPATVSGTWCWLYTRYFDTNNYHRVGYDGTTFKAQKVVSGVVTDYATPVAVSSAVSNGATRILNAEWFGNTLSIIYSDKTSNKWTGSVSNITNETFNNTRTPFMIDQSGGWTVNWLRGMNRQSDKYEAAITLSPTAQSSTALIQSNSLRATYRFTDNTNGHAMLACLYRPNIVAADPFEMRIVDLVDGTEQAFNGSRGGIIHGMDWLNGLLYIGSVDPGYFGVWDKSHYRIVGSAPDRDFYTMRTGLDGKVYMGTYSEAHGMMYDPNTDTITDYGKADSSFSISHYAYTVDGDANYVYVGMGEEPWYLGVYDKNAGTWTDYFYSESPVAGGVVRSADQSTIYYTKKLSGQSTVYYQFVAGVPTLLGSTPTLETDGQRGTITEGNLDVDPTYDFDTGDADGYTDHDPVVRWKLKTDSNYSSKTFTPVKLYDVDIQRMYDYGDPDWLLILGAEYLPVALWNPGTGEVDIQGVVPSSLYAVDYIAPYFYFNGYAAVCYRWDKNSAWTLNAGSPDKTLTNPKYLFGISKYHRCACVGTDGQLYIGVQHLRDSSGGDIGWYNPNDQTYGNLRTGFENYVPLSICNVGSKIIWSGRVLGAVSNAVIVKFDQTTKTIDTVYTPLSSTTGSVVVGVSSTEFVGIQIGTTVAYRYNINTGSIVWQVSLPGNAFGTLDDYDMLPFKDVNGKIWLNIDDDIYRLDPSDGSTVKVSDQTLPYNVLIRGSVAYLYGQPQVVALDVSSYV